MATMTVVDVLANQWPLITSTLLVLTATWVLQLAFKKEPLSKIPMAGLELGDKDKRRLAYLTDAQRVYREGYRKFKDMFQITTTRNRAVVVLHPKYLAELKNLPEDTIAFAVAMDEVMHAKYTGVQVDRPIIPHVVKKDLTPALNRLNPTIAAEVDQCFQEELPPCQDFTEVNINQKLLRIIAKVSGRIFIGPELCRNEEYIDAAINYTTDLMGATHAVTRLSPMQRFFKARSLPQVQTLKRRRENATNILKPIVESRRKAAKQDMDWQKPDDLLQWLMDGGESKFGNVSAAELADGQLAITFAAIHTTTMTSMNALYNLAVMPELIPELREEARAVLAEYGTFTTHALQKLKKLDSFLRETMRTEPLSITAFTRRILKTFTLSNGQVIPAGSNIEVASSAANYDPDLFNQPEKFDAFRFYRAREKEGLTGVQAAEAGASNQFVTVSPQNLTFGYGRHSCPGRFFAANEIKMIMSRAVLDYDIKLAEGETERYPSLHIAQSIIPDPSKMLRFKRVTV